MARAPLRLTGVRINRPPPEAVAAIGARARIGVAVEVENTTAAPLYVWSSPRGYDYDAGSKVLTVHMSEQPLALPPGVIMISDHPRAPRQVQVPPRSHATVQAEIPPVVRRPAPDGVGWVEEPIGEIASVEVDVQHAPTPVEAPRPHENSAQFRSRMQGHGDVARARLTPSAGGTP